MAYRRKLRKTYRRRFRKFRKTYRRRNAKASSNIHLFKRTKVDEHTLTNAGFVAIKSDITDNVYNDFRLDQLPNYTEFTALYDQYKICGIKQKFVFNRNLAEVASANAELPQLITVKDYTDTTALATEAEALQYKTFKSVRLDKPVSRYFRPTELTGFVLTKSVWTQSEIVDKQHYGLKVAIDTILSAGGTTLGTLKVFTTFYIAMRTPK